MQPLFNELDFQHHMFAEAKSRFRASVVGTLVAEQRLERDVGWDVMYRIRAGGAFRVIFVQYKFPELITRGGHDSDCA